MFNLEPLQPGPAVLYGRVSTADQTVDTQSAGMRTYCSRYPELQIHPDRIFLDPDTSGTIPLRDRTAGARMIRIIEQAKKLLKESGLASGHWNPAAQPNAEPVPVGPIRHVVVMRLDRLGRDSMDIIGNIRWLWENNITPHFVDMGPMPKNPFNEMILTVGAAFAQLERDLIATRTREKLHNKRLQHQLVGTVPYGYDAEYHFSDGHIHTSPTALSAAEISSIRNPQSAICNLKLLVPNYDEQATLHQMAAWRTTGMSLKKIAATLNAQSIPAKQGGLWQPGNIDRVLKSTYTKALLSSPSDPSASSETSDRLAA